MQHQSVAIVGAGFSGTLLSLHLLRHCPPSTRIRLIERAPDFGPGLAYSAGNADHLLNVPAGRMSAFPDRPRHFLEWLERQPNDVLNGPAPEAGTFVPRRLYGRYLQNLLSDAVRTCPAGRLELFRGRAIAITPHPAGLTLNFAGGRAITSSAAVIATGNTQPADPCPALQGTSFYQPNPWANDIADRRNPDGTVLLIGTGLTMVDTALNLLERGHRGPIHALSRRGLLPHAHARLPGTVPSIDHREIPRRLRELVRFIRIESERIAGTGGSWHAVVDALRPVTQDIWQTSSASERRRFLTHVRPWWDMHRHRMAPAIADRIEAARTRGQLRIHAGRISGCAVQGDAADVVWQPRGKSATASLRVQQVINCSGPETDVSNSSDPLFRSLLLTGLGRPDPLGLGFDVAEDGLLRGNSSDRLFAVGPICRSAVWEITAVPDIRSQCESLAHRIAVLARQRDGSDRIPTGLLRPDAALARIPGTEAGEHDLRRAL